MQRLPSLLNSFSNMPSSILTRNSLKFSSLSFASKMYFTFKIQRQISFPKWSILKGDSVLSRILIDTNTE